MSAPLLPLDAEPARIGGKAARLGRLRAAGVPVPPGEVVPAFRYEELLAASELGPVMEEAVAALERSPEVELVDLAIRHRQAALAATLPEAMKEALAPALEDWLGRHGRLILRSSAGGEDLAHASLAGLFRSRPRVTDLAAAFTALWDIWSSAAGPEVAATLLSRDVDPRRAGVAVLIQPELALEAAGVVFTVDPRAPRAGPVVELVRGGAAPLTEGTAAPEDLGAARRDAAIALARRVEEVLDEGPVDVELGWVEGEPVVLQARPVVLDPAMRTDVRWGRSLTRERYPRPLSPLAWSNLSQVFPEGIAALYAFLGAEIQDPDAVACRRQGFLMANEDLFDFAASVQLRVGPVGAARLLSRLGIEWLRRGARPGDLGALLRLVRRPGEHRTRLGDSPDSLAAWFGLAYVAAFLRETRARFLADFDDQVERFRARIAAAELHLGVLEAAAGMDGAAVARARAMEAHLREALVEFLRPDLVIFGAREVCFRTLDALRALCAPDATPGAWADALGVLPENPTSRLVGALGELAALRRAHGREGGEYREAFHAFLREHGHLSTSWDIQDPTLAEQPEVLDCLVAAAPPSTGASAPTPPAARIEALLAGHLGLLGPARELAEHLAALLRMDERHHLETTRVLPPSRRLVQLLGRELVRRGVLEVWEDAFFLEDHEVWRILEAGETRSRRYLVRLRRAIHARAAAAAPPGEVAAPAEVWHGEPGAGGRARGPARRVRSFADAAAFEDGEVLVVSTPDPLWSMLYPRAAALVSESGAALSHGVIAAREFGLPAVLGVEGALAALEPGAWLEVDGDRGQVRRVEPGGERRNEPGGASAPALEGEERS